MRSPCVSGPEMRDSSFFFRVGFVSVFGVYSGLGGIVLSTYSAAMSQRRKSDANSSTCSSVTGSSTRVWRSSGPARRRRGDVPRHHRVNRWRHTVDEGLDLGYLESLEVEVFGCVHAPLR